MLMHISFHVLCVNLTGRSLGDNRRIFLPVIIIALRHLFWT